MVTDLEQRQPAPKCLQSELVHTVESRPAGAGEEEKLPQRSPGPGTRGTAGGERELLCSKQGRKWGWDPQASSPAQNSQHMAFSLQMVTNDKRILLRRKWAAQERTKANKTTTTTKPWRWWHLGTLQQKGLVPTWSPPVDPTTAHVNRDATHSLILTESPWASVTAGNLKDRDQHSQKEKKEMGGTEEKKPYEIVLTYVKNKGILYSLTYSFFHFN